MQNIKSFKQFSINEGIDKRYEEANDDAITYFKTLDNFDPSEDDIIEYMLDYLQESYGADREIEYEKVVDWLKK